MTKKRGRLEVIYNILSIIKSHKNSIKSTPLLRRSNLSSQRFQEYFLELLEKEFIREVNDGNYGEGKLITLTDKGFKYLERYSAITSFIEEFDL
jgi:predicted transcriptional regulator